MIDGDELLPPDPLEKHPGIAWAFRLAELDGHPRDRLVVWLYARVHSGEQHLPPHQLTPEGLRAAYAETEALRERAKELTAELDAEGLLDWSLCK